LLEFYQKYPRSEVPIHTMSNLSINACYQDLYTKYLKLFYNDKEFREGCMEVSKSYLSNHFAKSGGEIGEYQYMIAVDSAVRYFLSELPVMMNMADILRVESCDYIYHDTPEFLRKIAADENLMPTNQRFLVLR
jgi:tRNA-dependent cyclodipeptide synthase